MPPQPEAEAGDQIGRRLFWIVTVLAAIWVLALALWNRDQGLPHFLHPDELNVVQPFVATFDPEGADWNPHRFTYPSGFAYLNAVLGRVWNLAAPLIGAPSIGFDLEGRLTAVRFGRTLCALLAALTVVLLALAGRVWFGPRPGAWAAALAAAAPLPTLQPHYVNVDTPLVFLLSACLWMAGRVHRLGRGRDFWTLAVLIGLAAGTKYPGAYALILPVALMGHRVRQSSGTESPRSWGWAIRRVLAASAVAGLVFLFTTPYAVFDFESFKSWFLYEADHAADRQLGWDLRSEGWVDRPYVYLLCAALPFAVGWPIGALGAWGLLSAFWRGRLAEGVLLALLGTWLVGAGWAETVFHRYALPLVPIWVLLGTAAFARVNRTGERRALAALAILGIANGTLMAASLSAQLRPEPSVQAVRWIEEHVPEGARVAIASTGGAEPEIFIFEDSRRYRWKAVEPDLAWLELESPEIVLLNGWWAIAYRRYPDAHPKAIALLDALEDADGAYELAAEFGAHFWTEGAYEILDRNFAAQFETPDVFIYRRR